MTLRSQPLRDLENDWLAAAPRAAHTHRAYRTELDRLARFLRSRSRDTTDLDAALLERFWRESVRGAWHETRQPPSASTLDQSRRILSAFIRWLVQQEHGPASLLAAVAKWRTPERPTPASVRSAPSPQSLPLSRLLEVSNLDGAASALCFWTGATPRELAALATCHVHAGRAYVELTQRGVRRAVAIPRPLAHALKSLIAPRQVWVFRIGAEPPTAAAMAQRVARWLRDHGGGQVTSARSLRAHFQRHAQARGWTSDEIRGQLRRPSLAPPPLVSPSPRRLATLLPRKRVRSSRLTAGEPRLGRTGRT
ncbi:MAG: hypothetical protein J0I71_03275 [Rhodanobacter sp.]|nr:hypothetical protein [Rhodanobacter sp.]